MAHVDVDYCLPLAEIAPLLVQLATEATEEEGAFKVPKEVEIEVNIAEEQKAIEAGVLTLGEPSNYACPACHGVLLQVKESPLFRFSFEEIHAVDAINLILIQLTPTPSQRASIRICRSLEQAEKS